MVLVVGEGGGGGGGIGAPRFFPSVLRGPWIYML